MKLLMLVAFSLASPAASQSSFQLEQKIVPLATASTSERLGLRILSWFGDDVAVSGSFAAVHAWGWGAFPGKNRPAVYVLEDVGGAWAPVAELRPPKATFDQRNFGNPLDLDGDMLVVCSPLAEDTGVVYVYRREPETGNWAETARIESPVPGPSFLGFGFEVALSGDTLAIGAPDEDSGRGAIYVYERQAGAPRSWHLTQRVQLDLPFHGLGQSFDLRGDTLVAWSFGTAGGTAGHVHVLERTAGPGGEWHLSKSFFTNSGARISVGDGAFVWSDPGHGPLNPAGEAEVIEKDANGAWTIFTDLSLLVHPLINTTTHRLGNDCALDGDTIVLGGRQVTAGSSSTPLGGAAYVFRRSAPGVWSLRETLRAPGPTFDDGFGDPVALSADVFLVGAPYDDDLGQGSGSVFAFRRP